MKLFIVLGILLVGGVVGLFGQETNSSAAPPKMTLLVSSSLVYDDASHNLGYLEAVVVDQDSGKIEFGLVSLANPAYRSVVTPIPWPLLQSTSDAQSTGGTPGKFRKFSVAVARETLLKAPRFNMAARAGMDDLVWMAGSYQYFGLVGGMGAPAANAGVRAGGEISATPPSEDEAMTEEEADEDAGPRPFYGSLPGAVEDIMYLGTNLFGPEFRDVVLEIVAPSSPRPVAEVPQALPDPEMSDFLQASNLFARNISRITNSAALRRTPPRNAQR